MMKTDHWTIDLKDQALREDIKAVKETLRWGDLDFSGFNQEYFERLHDKIMVQVEMTEIKPAEENTKTAGGLVILSQIKSSSKKLLEKLGS